MLKAMKTVLFLIICCSLTISLNAQKFTLGFSQGSGLAAHERIFEKDYGIGFPIKPVFSSSSMLTIGWNITKHIQLQTGAAFEIKGVERYYTQSQYFYITNPVLLRLNLMPSQTSKAHFYITGGLYNALLVKHIQRYVNSGPAVDIYLPEYAKPVKQDYGGILGLGGTYDLTQKWSLGAGLRFSHGFRDLYREEWGEWPGTRMANVNLLFNMELQYKF